MTLLVDLEQYYDTVPRANADVSDLGPFTLFVSRGGFPYYARPRLGLPADARITPADVAEVRARQSELGVPEALEWVHETTPSLLDAARATDLVVEEIPLLVLDGEPVRPPAADRVRILGPHDPELGSVLAAIHVGFSAPGTEPGAESIAERDAYANDNPDLAERLAARIEGELTVAAGAFDGVEPVGGGQHQPRGDTTEIGGVAVLPSHRRRGLGAALSWRLARQALDTGVTTVFCSAQDDAVARVYERVGFRRVGTACIASAP